MKKYIPFIFVFVFLISSLSFKIARAQSFEVGEGLNVGNGTTLYCEGDNQVLFDSGYGAMKCKCKSGYSMNSAGKCVDSSFSNTNNNSYPSTYGSYGNGTYCVPPIVSGCTTQNDLGVIQMQNARNGMSGSSVGAGMIDACSSQINKYQSDLLAYNSCLSKQASSTTSQISDPEVVSIMEEYDKNKACKSADSNSWYNKKIDKCACYPDYEMGTVGSCVKKITPVIDSCTNKYPNSIISPKDSKYCACLVGYNWNSNNTACVTLDASCNEKWANTHSTGTDSVSGDNKCGCKTGYQWNSDKTACVTTQSLLVDKNKTVAITTNPTINFIRTLKKGMVGDDVKLLQQSLIKLGYLPAGQQVSTTFGKLTQNAIVKFQKDNNIKPATGSFGPTTQKIFIQKLQVINN